jgi:transposase-like protein
MRPRKFFKILRQEFEVIHFKGCHFPKESILMAIRWYIAYPLSYHHVEELMEERGLKLDHATVNRWVVKYSPTLESKFRQFKKTQSAKAGVWMRLISKLKANRFITIGRLIKKIKP